MRIGAGEVLAHEEIPSDSLPWCVTVLRFIDIIAAKGGIVPTHH